MTDSSARQVVHHLGRYELHPERRELLLRGRSLVIGARAFDLLLLLCEAKGRVVTKAEIIDRVWSGLAVEENNIQVQVSALRRVLAEEPGLIRTIARQGYCLTFPPTGEAEVPGAGARAGAPPPALSELIGREEELEQVTALLAAQRLVTIVGAGGMGKTALALEIARRLGPEYPDGVFLLELASLADGPTVMEAIRSALGLNPSQGGDLIGNFARALEHRRLLVVLDNCEQLIDAVAEAAEWLLRVGRSVHVLATSRERLRAEGEAVFHLGGLALPELEAEAEEAPTSPAMRLFVDRAQAAGAQLQVDAPMQRRIAAICHRLDGMPLALELAAAHVATLGIAGVELGLQDRLELLTGGRRTAQPRQQTLRATLDWSHDLLGEEERIVLRRLCLFPASFDLGAAAAVLGRLGEAWRPGILMGLVARSLIVPETAEGGTFYRILETTREYGLEKLALHGEGDAAMEALGAHCLQRLADLPDPPSTALARSIIGNLRAVLDWSFPDPARRRVGIELTALSGGLWLHLSLDRELVERASLAILHVEEQGLAASQVEMQLRAALASALFVTEGTSARCRTCWERTLVLARDFGDAAFEARALRGLATFAFTEGDFTSSLAFARQFAARETIRDGSSDLLIGSALHSLARLDESRLHLRKAVAAAEAGPSRPARYSVDTLVAAIGMLARVSWLIGHPEDARSMVEEALATSRGLGHANTRCSALEVGILLAIRLGDHDDAEARLAELRAVARRHGLLIWEGFADWLEGWLVSERGDPQAALRVLRRAMAASEAARGRVRYNLLASNIATALGRSGAPAEGLALIQENLAQIREEQDGLDLFIPEHRRIEAELMGWRDAADPAAEAQLREVIALSRSRGIVAYELRAAVTLAELLARQGRPEAAAPLLASACARYRPEDQTSDLREARALLR